MSIVIPKRLEKLLKKEPIWLTNVTQLCQNTVGLYENSPEFFPDYTIHGIGHINEVLEHADSLIEQKSLRKLTGRDAAFLIAAVILHDAGMFLRLDGVQKLVTGQRRTDCIEHSGDAQWDQVWSEFVDRTKRYPEDTMRYLFGQNITINERCISKTDMTSNDKRVIGEFLRENHGRIAHEIAVNSLPGTQDIDLFLHTSFTAQDRNLIGLLARSHSMGIRDTEPYIRKVFGKGAHPYNTPVFYLMIVLRIADALDAGKHRISKFRDIQQKIRVPISAEEWIWNERIDRSICRWDPAEKTRYIYAEPTTSIEYVQLDKWLKQTQAELDLCWSILSEKYADDHCRLSIHRILCNIHEPDVQKTMNGRFLTREVKVSANPEIAKLMIAPLYGDNPSYGVRELIQNAVDACIEREEKEHKANRLYQGHVTIRLDRDTFMISDNGIGMDENVLLNYYLCAGASYRNSDEWKQSFTEDGKARVARTGRFGVGFLAAFLLGDTIEVCTQHMGDEKGYEFSFEQDSKPLNIRRTRRTEGAGTTITIRLKAGVYNSLAQNNIPGWRDWYVFDDPVVEYYADGKPIRNWGTHLSRNSRNHGWFTLDSNQYESYQWSPSYGSGGFFCNGIRIHDAVHSSLSQRGLNVYWPAVSVVDKNAILNVDLARAKVLTFPEEETLIEQLFRYHIARILTVPWDTEEDYQTNLKAGFELRSGNHIPFLLSPHGYQLNYASVLSAMEISEYMLLYAEAENCAQGTRQILAHLPTGLSVTVAPTLGLNPTHDSGLSDFGLYTSSPVVFAEGFLSNSIPMFSYDRVQYRLTNSWRCVWIQERNFRDIHEYHRKTLYIQDKPGGAYVIASKYTPDSVNCDSAFDSEYSLPPEAFLFNLEDFLPPAGSPVAILIHPGKHMKKDSLFANVLKQVLVPAAGHPQDLWIPFDPDERRKKFPTAFRELEVYIRSAEAEKRTEKRYAYNPSVRKFDDVTAQQEAALASARQFIMRDEFQEKQESQQDEFLRIHRPDLVDLQKELSHGTRQEKVTAYLHYAAKYAAASSLDVPLETAPDQIVDRLETFLTNFFAVMLAEDKLDEQAFDDVINSTLSEFMELFAQPMDLFDDETLMEDVPLDMQNELISIMEELQRMRGDITE